MDSKWTDLIYVLLRTQCACFVLTNGMQFFTWLSTWPGRWIAAVVRHRRWVWWTSPTRVWGYKERWGGWKSGLLARDGFRFFFFFFFFFLTFACRCCADVWVYNRCRTFLWFGKVLSHFVCWDRCALSWNQRQLIIEANSQTLVLQRVMDHRFWKIFSAS